MIGPVECKNMDKSNDFSEFMWMAEEDIDDFDKQFEQQLGEEMMMNEALDMFEEQQEAALYAQENLPLPRHRQQRNNRQNRGSHHGQGMNHMQQQQQQHHMNGYGDPAAAGNAVHNPGAHNGPVAQPPQDPAVLAAGSSLNPNAPAFVFNPNAPVFVPSWASGAGAASAAAAATAATEDKNATTLTNGTREPTTNGSQ